MREHKAHRGKRTCKITQVCLTQKLRKYGVSLSVYVSPIVQSGCLSNRPLRRHGGGGGGKERCGEKACGWSEIEFSLNRSLWEGVDTTVESLALFSYLGLETCTLLAWLYLWTLCFPCLCPFVFSQVSLENSSLLCCTERNNVLLFMLPQSEDNTFSVGVEERMGWDGGWHGRGWGGGNSGCQSERSLKERPCACVLLGPFLLYVLWQGWGQWKGTNAFLLVLLSSVDCRCSLWNRHPVERT